jgi:hypothetical protein
MFCEHYVISWRYGIGFSTQADNAFKSLLLGVLIVFGTSAIVGFIYFANAQRKENKSETSKKNLK